MGDFRTVHRIRVPHLSLVLAGVLLAFADCESMRQKEMVQFQPIPVAEVGKQELGPVQPRTVTELLRAANDAFTSANAAQEKGDHEASLRHYTLMLELLIEADLDPTIFYDLRNEFDRILNTSSRQARAYERTEPSALSAEELAVMARSELDYPYPLPERVLVELDQIQTLYGRNYEAGLERSYRYTPYIREEFRKAGLPQDLVWLAMVESQFTPKIVSRVGAGGMWQFMKATARAYGLRVDDEVDERYDWRKSTKAAIAYLSDLYEMFDGSWPLAVSAYNMGARGLERAIALNGGERNLWKLIETPPAANRIRRETKKFYPKLLASAIVAKNPGRYGIDPDPHAAENTRYMTIKGSYALADLEDEVGLPSRTLQKLNPQFIRGYTPYGMDNQVVVPVDSRTKVAAAVRRLPQLRKGTHVVWPGETPGGIARRYHVSANELMRANNIASARLLRIGQRLVIPGFAAESGPSARATASAAGGRKTYTVRRGDSLSKIATRYRVTVPDLQAMNNLGRQTRIHVGDTLVVARDRPAPAVAPAPATKPKGKFIEHTVAAGEFPGKIAKRYRVRVDDFLSWNGLKKTSTIHIGQKLKVYGVAPARVPETAAAAGDNGTANLAKAASAVRTEPVAKPESAAKLEAAAKPESPARPEADAEPESAAKPDAAAEPEVTAKAIIDKVRSKPQEAPKRIHKVARGENPSTIAAKYKVRTRDFLDWNGLSSKSVLHIGDEYVVHVPSDGAGPAKTESGNQELAKAPSGPPAKQLEETTHVVTRGQNPSTIAQRYGVRLRDLFTWNGWEKDPLLHIGDKVIVRK